MKPKVSGATLRVPQSLQKQTDSRRCLQCLTWEELWAGMSGMSDSLRACMGHRDTRWEWSGGVKKAWRHADPPILPSSAPPSMSEPFKLCAPASHQPSMQPSNVHCSTMALCPLHARLLLRNPARPTAPSAIPSAKPSNTACSMALPPASVITMMTVPAPPLPKPRQALQQPAHPTLAATMRRGTAAAGRAGAEVSARRADTQGLGLSLRAIVTEC